MAAASSKVSVVRWVGGGGDVAGDGGQSSLGVVLYGWWFSLCNDDALGGRCVEGGYSDECS